MHPNTPNNIRPIPGSTCLFRLVPPPRTKEQSPFTLEQRLHYLATVQIALDAFFGIRKPQGLPKHFSTKVRRAAEAYQHSQPLRGRVLIRSSHFHVPPTVSLENSAEGRLAPALPIGHRIIVNGVATCGGKHVGYVGQLYETANGVFCDSFRVL